jgi:hypothetical protein
VVFIVVVSVGSACTSGPTRAGSRAQLLDVAKTLRSIDASAKKARMSTAVFFNTDPNSAADAKLALLDADQDWKALRFQTRVIVFTPAQMRQNEYLGPAIRGLTAAADAWVGYFEGAAELIEGEGPADSARADRLLLEAKKKDVYAMDALNQATRQALLLLCEKGEQNAECQPFASPSR